MSIFIRCCIDFDGIEESPFLSVAIAVFSPSGASLFMGNPKVLFTKGNWTFITHPRKSSSLLEIALWENHDLND